MLYRRRGTMIEKAKMAMLLDFYGDVLTEKQREAMDMYYNNDFSLSEIAENTGISRQGVRDRLQKSEQIIVDLESKLRLYERYCAKKADVTRIVNLLEQIKRLAPAEISEITEIANGLLDK